MRKRQGMRKLDLSVKSDKIREAEEFLRSHMVGQEDAQNKLLEDLCIFHAGIGNPLQPIGAQIFAGPTGVGKTLMAKLFSYALFGCMEKYDSCRAAPITLINGSELMEKHAVAKLIGAPPGYVGYDGESEKMSKGDNPPGLAQKIIDKPYLNIMDIERKREEKEIEALFREIYFAERYPTRGEGGKRKRYIAEKIKKVRESLDPLYSVVVFDEIEKAHSDIWSILLQILQEGKLVVGNGDITYFNNSYIILTTNIGQEKTKRTLSGKASRVGYGAMEDVSEQKLGSEIIKGTRAEVKKKFPSELLGRFGGEEEGVSVFHPLTKGHAGQILEMQISDISEKVKTEKEIEFKISDSAKEFLVEKGFSQLYGARTLEKALKKYIRKSISVVVNSYPNINQLNIEYEGGDKLVFYGKERKKRAKHLSA